MLVKHNISNKHSNGVYYSTTVYQKTVSLPKFGSYSLLQRSGKWIYCIAGSVNLQIVNKMPYIS